MGMRQWRGENEMLEGIRSQPVSRIRSKDWISSTRPTLKKPAALRNELFSKRLELREFLTNPTIKVESIQLEDR